MAKRGASRNYKFGPKNNWRRWLWNEVLSRTRGAEQTLPILYLAGSGDYDRAIATSKGVPDRNLIAIDINSHNVHRVKDGGSPALHEDITEVLLAWPHDRLVSAVVLDFCCGLTEYTTAPALSTALSRNPFACSVKVINLMRGRDNWSNGLRSDLSKFGLTSMLLDSTFPRHNEALTWSDKNRAIHHLLLNAHCSWAGIVQVCGSWSEAIDTLYEVPLATALIKDYGPEDAEKHAMQIGVQYCLHINNPTFHSYKSGDLVFDSAVYDGKAVGVSLETLWEERLLAADKQFLERYSHTILRDVPCNLLVKRRVGAMLAVRSRRINTQQKPA